MIRKRYYIISLMLVVSALCYLLGAMGQILDDHSAENAIAADLEQAQRVADVAWRRDMAAVKFCRETVGESFIRWTEDEQLVCVPRRGGKMVEVTTD